MILERERPAAVQAATSNAPSPRVSPSSVTAIRASSAGPMVPSTLASMRRRLNPCLTYADIGIYTCMARAATTADTFNAVAEPRRRQILDALAGGELPVNDLVHLLDMGQPQVSKHLRVLREVGAVAVRDQGRQRLYRLNGEALKPIHDWIKPFERLWSERFDELDAVLDDLTKEEGHAHDD